MLDIKELRDNPDLLKTLLARRNTNNPWKDQIEDLTPENFFELDSQRKSFLQEIEKLSARRNQIAQEFPKLKKLGQDTSALTKEIEEIKTQMTQLEEKFATLDSKLQNALLRLPNLPDVSVPQGKSEAENKEVRQVGEIKELGFEGKAHWDIGEDLGILDFAAAGKISGARFSLLRGAGAKLERALINYMLDTHTQKHGYNEVYAPYLVTAKTMQGTGQLPKFEEDLFKLASDDLYLIPTAEVSVTNMHAGDVFNADQLPLKYVCYSSCFRREAGSYGKDTRGLIRNHQFNKVELVWFTKPETGFNDLEVLTSHAEAILSGLGIPYRVMLLCSGDMGFASAKTYDLEVWMPGEKRWREISSCSCFTNFQARRMNAKYKNAEGKRDFVYTLNGSGVAVGRLFAALLENYQQADGSVLVPPALQPYMQTEKIDHV